MRKMRFVITATLTIVIVGILTLAANHPLAQPMSVQTEKLISLKAAKATQSAITFEKGFSLYTETSFLDLNNITSNSFNESSLPPLTIWPQNVSLYRDSIGTIHIVGVLINPFTFPIQSVQVTASAHNANHQLISTGSTYANIDQLRPREKSGFDIVVTSGVENAFNYDLSVSYERAGTLKPAALYLYMGQTSIDSGGTYHLLGEVTNMGSTPTSSVDVYASLVL